MIGTIAFFLVTGTVFTLYWWKVADKWADAEHKRFRVKEDTRERVVVRPDDESSMNPRE